MEELDMRKSILIKSGMLLLSILNGSMASEAATAQPKQSRLKSVMVLEHSAGTGYRASCDHLNALLHEHGIAHGFTVNVLTLDANLDFEFSPENLAKYQAVILAYNDGVHRFIAGAARNNFEKYVENGGGLLAVHSASAFIEGWPWMDSVLVQKFYGPWQNWPAADLKQDAEGLKLDSETRGIAKDLTAPDGFKDAFYQFQANPRGKPGVTVLVTVDEQSSTSPFSNAMGTDHPVVWAKTVGKGRVVHNSLGFSSEARNLNAYTQKENYLGNLTYNTLRYAAGDFIGCMDSAFAEFNPDATKSDPSQCATPATALLRFKEGSKQNLSPMVFQNGSGAMVNVEFTMPGPHSITVVDVAGNQIYRKTGSGRTLHSVPFPGRSGIYIVKAKAGGKLTTHRVTTL